MKVKWGNSLFAPFQVGNWVKQGGIVSPCLFNVYMDDLSSQLKYKCICRLVQSTNRIMIGLIDPMMSSNRLSWYGNIGGTAFLELHNVCSFMLNLYV